MFWRLLAVQSVVLILVMIVLISFGKISEFRSTEGTIEILRQAVFRQPTGELSLRETEDREQCTRDRARTCAAVADP
ncbi:sensor histidine kinase, partial [Rhizobium leguminosarum]